MREELHETYNKVTPQQRVRKKQLDSLFNNISVHEKTSKQAKGRTNKREPNLVALVSFIKLKS